MFVFYLAKVSSSRVTNHKKTRLLSDDPERPIAGDQYATQSRNFKHSSDLYPLSPPGVKHLAPHPHSPGFHPCLYVRYCFPGFLGKVSEERRCRSVVKLTDTVL